MYKFTYNQLNEAAAFYDLKGFVMFTDLLSLHESDNVSNSYDEARVTGSINYSENEFLANDDSIYQHKEFERLAYNIKINTIVKKLLNYNNGIELQHCKLNDKPSNRDAGFVPWHQDYPFFPHTNYDLLACTVHIDRETIESGPLVVLPGSHKWGALPHTKNGKFTGIIEDGKLKDIANPVALECEKGEVHFHHCLLVHTSYPNTSGRRRKHLIYQFRAEDAIQLAGPLWRCTGVPISSGSRKGYARFSDNSEVEIRGIKGGLFDLFGVLAPK
jgi:ectoine hydroxylase-related dioxygenase (phytanoyl-CoA dioxygenase family)